VSHVEGISPARVRREAARFPRRPFAAMAIMLVGAPFLMAISDHFTSKSGPLPSRMTWALVAMIEGLLLTMCSLLTLWQKKDRYPDPVSRGFLRWLEEVSGKFAAVRIADAAFRPEGARFVAMGGRMMSAGEGSSLVAPISGTPCLYYRVVVEQWTDRPFPQDPWTECGQTWQLDRFVLVDESGVVMVEAPDEESSSSDKVEAQLSISSRTIVVESRSGIRGLPPHVHSCIEERPQHFRSIEDSKRTRVTELTLVDGDVVAVLGYVEARVVSTGAFRGERAFVITSEAPRRVFAATLDDLRRLGLFHLRFALALVALALLGGVIFGIGLLLVRR
jgi:hypothetical protein